MVKHKRRVYLRKFTITISVARRSWNVSLRFDVVSWQSTVTINECIPCSFQGICTVCYCPYPGIIDQFLTFQYATKQQSNNNQYNSNLNKSKASFILEFSFHFNPKVIFVWYIVATEKIKVKWAEGKGATILALLKLLEYH